MSDNRADIRTVEITSFDNETVEMDAKAKEVAKVLVENYPDHIWMVGFAPGFVLVVKNMAGDNRYGYTIAARGISAKELSHRAMIAGGELLERMGMVRGKWNGEIGNPYQL